MAPYASAHGILGRTPVVHADVFLVSPPFGTALALLRTIQIWSCCGR
jgi:hypothetical protein